MSNNTNKPLRDSSLTSVDTTTMSLKLLLPLLASIIAMSPLAIDMYLPAMPLLAQYFNTDMPSVQNSLSIYLLGYGMGLLLFGPLADKFSRRKLVMLGIAGFMITSIMLPFAGTITQFLILRFGQAFISSAATVVVPGTIKELYGKDTAKGLSYVSMIMMLAPMIAPSIGSLLLLHSWQLIFFSLAMYSLLIFIFVYRYLPEKKTASSSNQVSFIGRYKKVLSNAKVRLDIISSVVISFAFFSYLTAIPFVYLTVFNVSEFIFSVLFAINVLAFMTAHFINTRSVSLYGSRKILFYGLFVAVLFSLLLVTVNYWQMSLVYTAIIILPLMGSLSIIVVNADALILQEFAYESGTATAVIGTLRFSLGALAGPILAYFYNGTALPFTVLMLCSAFIVVVCQSPYLIKALSKLYNGEIR